MMLLVVAVARKKNRRWQNPQTATAWAPGPVGGLTIATSLQPQ
jgi:hypothetical protein